MWTISKSLSTISSVRLVAPMVGCSGVRMDGVPPRHRLAARNHLPMMTSKSIESSPPASFIEEARRQVDEALRRYLPASEDAEPSVPLGWPRRCATACWAAASGCGRSWCCWRPRPAAADPAAALPAACAVEMVHTYSLIHDDLPAMDDDDLRRGRPTCHKAFDEATAILAGDAPADAGLRGRWPGTSGPPRRRSACVRALAEAAGPAGMVGGPDGRPRGRGADRRRRLEALEAIHRRKTGALLRASLRLGAIVAGADEASLRGPGRLRRCGGPGVPDRRRPARRAGGRGQAGQAGRQGRRAWESGPIPACSGSRRAGGGPGSWPTRPSRPWRPLGDAGDRLRALALDLLERDR